MLTFARTHWSKISVGLMLAALVGAGGATVYDRFLGSCCHAGAACCFPGSPCCHGRQVAQL
jgi:hypothetical protein